MPTERKNISQPSDLWRAIENAASRECLSVSEWMANCCIPNLPAKVQKTLSKRLPVGTPKKLSDNLP